MAHGLMFHHFHGGAYPASQGSIDADTFNRILDHAGGSKLCGARAWLDGFTGPVGRDDRICVTFDDALRCQIDIALPVLEARGQTAFFFVYSSVFEGVMERLEVYRHHRMTAYPTPDAFYDAFFAQLETSPHGDAVAASLRNFQPGDYLADFPFYTDGDRTFRFVRDRVLGESAYFEIMDAMIATAGYDEHALRRRLWMNDSDLRALAEAGHIVGLHSYSHPTDMAGLPPARQQAEYSRNQAHLSAILGQPATTVAHPCGSYSDETLDILTRMGVVAGFRSDMVRKDGFGPLEAPRLDHAVVLAELGN